MMYFSLPRADISKIILNTLTQIACKSLTNVDETVSNNIVTENALKNEETKIEIIFLLFSILVIILLDNILHKIATRRTERKDTILFAKKS
jgi:hypothetical protein